MPLYLFYTMVQKSKKWPKTQIKGGGGSCLLWTPLRASPAVESIHSRWIESTRFSSFIERSCDSTQKIQLIQV